MPNNNLNGGQIVDVLLVSEELDLYLHNSYDGEACQKEEQGESMLLKHVIFVNNRNCCRSLTKDGDCFQVFQDLLIYQM
jgi:hypothetical protein